MPRVIDDHRVNLSIAFIRGRLFHAPV